MNFTVHNISIKYRKAKEDLKKLIKHFPLQDEFVIKWAYYQFLDYKETYKYLSRKDENTIFFIALLPWPKI